MQNRAFNSPLGFVHMEELVVSDTSISMPGEEQAAAKGMPTTRELSTACDQPRPKTPVMQLHPSTQLFHQGPWTTSSLQS